MATIRLLVAMSGAESWAAGALYECDEASAARLVAAGRAEWLAPSVVPVVPVPAPAAPETTMARGGYERAVKPRGKARG